MEDTWVLLKSYLSVSEARVVESFLRAQGLDVQLLDQHTYSLVPVRTGGRGMRLMVREPELDRARQLLANAEATSHLSVVNDMPEGTPPPLTSVRDRILILFLLGLALAWAITKF